MRDEAAETRYRRALEVILRRLPATRVCQLSVGLVLDFRKERLGDGVGPGTVNIEVAALNRLLRWGGNGAVWSPDGHRPCGECISHFVTWPYEHHDGMAPSRPGPAARRPAAGHGHRQRHA